MEQPEMLQLDSIENIIKAINDESVADKLIVPCNVKAMSLLLKEKGSNSEIGFTDITLIAKWAEKSFESIVRNELKSQIPCSSHFQNQVTIARNDGQQATVHVHNGWNFHHLYIVSNHEKCGDMKELVSSLREEVKDSPTAKYFNDEDFTTIDPMEMVVPLINALRPVSEDEHFVLKGYGWTAYDKVSVAMIRSDASETDLITKGEAPRLAQNDVSEIIADMLVILNVVKEAHVRIELSEELIEELFVSPLSMMSGTSLGLRIFEKNMWLLESKTHNITKLCGLASFDYGKDMVLQHGKPYITAVAYREDIGESGHNIMRIFGTGNVGFIVKFANEGAAGLAPTQEFFVLYSHWIRDNKTIMDHCSYGRQYGHYPHPETDPEVLYDLGILLARGMMQNLYTDIYVSRAFLNWAVLGIHPTLSHTDPRIHEEITTTSVIGKEYVIPFHPEIKVSEVGTKITAENEKEFRDLLDRVLIDGVDGAIAKGVQKFRDGLTTVLTHESLVYMNLHKNKVRIQSINTIWKEIEQFVELSCDEGAVDQREWFIKALSKWRNSYHVTDFINFVTGSKNPPPEGMASIVPRIRVLWSDKEIGAYRLPTAMTCDHVMFMPAYETKKLMKKAMFTAWDECATGFIL